LSKVYILSHEHLFEDGHADSKLIGVFISKEKALKILEDYKNLEGFRSYKEGFEIQEYIINEISYKILNELISIL